ncbi:MAG: hypothetical protein AEth_01845 [Candidatus Argoarchaeum ethanivorans]|uniref:HEAT repeat domain-containing protein n=1 Tax=Candidatus Argoarchaeum ethanivorans TaxID=2608793 RepID=A0A8B3S092_9EURY|nr:MAG: hypothetical protein AEth_01845 [Candidatus Argoarchaeum ethanivorans]
MIFKAEKEINKYRKKLKRKGFFSSSSEEEQLIAALELGKIGDPIAIPELIKVLEISKYRKAAAEALGNIRDQRVSIALIKALTPEGIYKSDDRFLSIVAEALGKIRDPSAVSSLTKILDLHYSLILAPGASARALGKIGGRNATIALFRHIGYDSSHFKKMVHEALENIIDQSTVPDLLKDLEDGDEDLRGYSAWALGKIGNPSVVPALIKALEDSIFVQDYAAEALGKMGDSSVVPALIKALVDNNLVGAAEALGKIGDSSAVPDLIKALGDSNYMMRFHATEALGNINDISSLGALEYIMKNDSENKVQSAAFESAVKIRSPHKLYPF